MAVQSTDAPPFKRDLESRYRKFPTEEPPLRLVQDGTPQAVIIVPVRAGASAREGARLLQETLREISGALLPIVEENRITLRDGAVKDSEGREWPFAIWLGATERAGAEGIRADNLRPEGFLLRSRGNGLFIVGRDDNGHGLAVNGTRHGVVSLLERYLGARWLWPGESVLPAQKTIELPALHEQDEPAIAQRIIRNSGRINSKEEIGLRILKADGGEARYLALKRQQGEWLARQRTGSSLRLVYGHAYDGWHEKHGAEHPEWFALQPDNTREQMGGRARLCKSNAELAKAIARDILERKAANPDQTTFPISPNDGGSRNFFCMCEECRKLDPVNADKVKLMFATGEKREKRFHVDYPSLSDRVATFYNRIAEATGDADVQLGAYAYSAYRNPPLGVRLHPKILIGFVGLGYFDEGGRKADLARWNGWCAAANELFLRPNFLHAGAGLPSVYVRRMDADIKHCYRTGMVAGDFDSLIGNWSTQGLNYYVLARLLWDPSLDVEEVVKDYCRAGFGDAAPAVLRYFNRLEEATLQLAEAVERENRQRLEAQLREDEEEYVDTRHAHREVFETAALEVYTPALLAELRELLAEAAEKDAAVQARVAFLRLGLDYAELELAYYRASSETERSAREKLLAFYRELFATQPLAINSVDRLYRGHAIFRSLP